MRRKLTGTVTAGVTDSFDLKHHSVGIASYRGEIQLFSEAKANQISRPGIHEEASLGKNYKHISSLDFTQSTQDHIPLADEQQ